MKTGLSTWCFLGLDVFSALRKIGDAGFEYIELWGVIPHAYPGWVDERALKDALSSYQMTLSMHAPFTDLNPATPFEPTKGAVERTLEEFVRFSASLEAKAITIHPGSVHNEAMVPASLPNSVSTIRKVVEAADGRVAISVENQTRSRSKYHYPLGSSVASLEAILAEVEELRFTLDTGHAHSSGLDPSSLAKVAGPRLMEVHLSDNAGEYDDHLIPGDGTAGLANLMKTLEGSEVLICLELNPHRYLPEQVLGAGVSFKSGLKKG